MSGSVNKAIIIGNVGKDPVIRRNTAGDPVATFNVATSENWRDKATGERKEQTDWHKVVVANAGLVEVVEKYVKKGKKVYCEGKMRTRSYEKDGQTKYITEVVIGAFHSKLQLLERVGGSGAGDESSYGAKHDDMDDEIPF